MNDAVVPGGAPRWRVFPVLALGTLMATLDLSIVNIALPTLSRDLHAPLATVAWVVLAYVLTITGLLLGFGRLADRLGRRRIYGLGLGVFSVASLLCALAPGAGALIAARTLQGVGAAMMTANSTALLAANFPADERGRALGAFGAMVGVGLAIGPPLGGMLVAHASWRWIFFINLPLGLLAWALLRQRVPADVRSGSVARLPTDVVQPFLWATGLAGLMLALTRGPESGWGDPLVLGCATAGALLLAAFLAVQSRSLEPLLPLDLIAGPLGAAVSLTFLSQVLSVSVGFHMPLVLEETGGLTAAQSGAWLAVLPGAALICAPVAGRLADRLGARTLTVTGMALTAVGLWLLANLGAMPAGARLASGLALVGIGQGLFAVPNASALLSLVPPERLGLASGLQSTTRNLGLAAGVAFTGAMVTARYHSHSGAPLHLGAAGGVEAGSFVLATHETFQALAVLALVSTWLAWRARSGGRGAGAPAGPAPAASGSA